MALLKQMEWIFGGMKHYQQNVAPLDPFANKVEEKRLKKYHKD